MYLLTSKNFDKYKDVSNKVIKLLCNEECSSLHDINILYNILMNFPYCLDVEGHYIYNGKFYESLSDLPKDGLEAVLNRLKYSIIN